MKNFLFIYTVQRTCTDEWNTQLHKWKESSKCRTMEEEEEK